jgi:hypothetical protein
MTSLESAPIQKRHRLVIPGGGELRNLNRETIPTASSPRRFFNPTLVQRQHHTKLNTPFSHLPTTTFVIPQPTESKFAVWFRRALNLIAIGATMYIAFQVLLLAAAAAL